MAQTKPRGKYQGVSLPEGLIREIKKHILKDERYKSIAEFIREACREKIKRDKGKEPIKKYERFFGFDTKFNNSDPIEMLAQNQKEIIKLLKEK